MYRKINLPTHYNAGQPGLKGLNVGSTPESVAKILRKKTARRIGTMLDSPIHNQPH